VRLYQSDVSRYIEMALQDDSAIGSLAQFTQLLAAINKVKANIDAELSQMKHKLMEERESANDRLVKKMHLEKRLLLRLATRSSLNLMSRYGNRLSLLSLH